MMASKKKLPDTQASLFTAAPIVDVPPADEAPVVFTPPPDVTIERPKLRLVPGPEKIPEEDVLVEKVRDNVYEVSTLRDHGTTSAVVFYTRAQLEMLITRAKGALEL